jgi:HlyD family secretion protein
LARLSGSTEISVASQISGFIESTGPREGVTVKKGVILAKILVEDLIEERSGIEQQRKIALSEKKRTRDELIRQQKLIKSKLTTQELLDAKKAAAIAADSQVLTIDKQLSAIDVRIGYGIVRAPKDAIIAAKLAETGDVAQPGKALYKLTVDSAARINVHLPQQVLEKTQVNSKVILTHGSKKKTIFLTRIFPALDAQNIGSAEADLANMPFSLRSGARITARVVIKEIENALIVPHRALVITGDSDGNKGFVFKIIDDNGVKRIARVKVNIQLYGHEGIAISGGLAEADEVVVAHQSVLMQLKDNDLVSPSEIDHNDF